MSVNFTPIRTALVQTFRIASRTSSSTVTSCCKSQRRWNSTQKIRTTPAAPQKSSKWSASTAFLLAAATGGAAYGYATYAHQNSTHEYSREGKFKKPQYGNVKDLEACMKEIRSQLDEDTLSIEPEVLHLHGFSEWSHCNPSQLPVCVAYPQNTEEVSVIAKACHKYRIPMVGFSGGTSLEGNFSAPYGGMSIDFAFMDRIVKLNKEDLDIVVQPSVSWMDLNEEIAASGLFFPVDPGPSARIGGMVGTNCSGTNAVRYGTMKDWVINLTVVLADGTIIKTKRRPRKTSAGYNLNSLFVGSEGTLGLVTEITLKLAVIPEELSVAVVEFPTIRDAAAAAAQVIKQGIPIHCLELMDEVSMRVVNRSGATKPLVWKEVPTLFLKFSGTKAGVKENIAKTKQISKANKGGDFRFAATKQEQKMLWSARKEALWSMLAQRQGSEEVWSTDVAVPLSRLADIIEISKKEMDDLGLFASILGHVGDGNFHESILYDKTKPGEREKVEKCVKNMVSRALEMEGTCTGEHGVGLGKREALVEEVGQETVDVMRSIKLSLDTRGLMNPGKIMELTR